MLPGVMAGGKGSWRVSRGKVCRSSTGVGLEDSNLTGKPVTLGFYYWAGEALAGMIMIEETLERTRERKGHSVI